MFVCFLYHLHHLTHLKVLKIMFSKSRLFPHADDHLFREALSKLAERRSDADIGVHVELHQPATGAAIIVHHATQVLAGVEGLGHVLRLNVVVECGGDCRILVPCELHMPHNIILFGSTPTISSLHSFSFILTF